MSYRARTYWEYIQVESLLSLQTGCEGSEAALTNHEVAFILLHQVEELWFKLVLQELALVRNALCTRESPRATLAEVVHSLHRSALVLRHAAQTFDLMETLTTRDYLAFRDKLRPASGFQSAQFREIEILLGVKDSERIPLGSGSYRCALHHSDGTPSPALRRVDARLLDRPTLAEAAAEWLFQTPIEASVPGAAGDEKVVLGFIDQHLASLARQRRACFEVARQQEVPEPELQRLQARNDRELESARAFLHGEDQPSEARWRASRVRAAIVRVECYGGSSRDGWAREVVGGLLELEQAFVMFRQRHARTVERLIGYRSGTAGSAGVDYLDQSALHSRVFRDLWAARTLLSATPPSPNRKQAIHVRSSM
jgi:tryptophan 2,3-dioxygenase